MWLGKEVLLWNIDSGKYSASDIIGTFIVFLVVGLPSDKFHRFSRTLHKEKLHLEK